MFIDALDVDDVIAHLLVTEGFTALEQVAFVPVEELAQIEGFDEEVAEELRARARAHLEEMDRHNEERRRELGVADALTEVEGLTPAMLVMLGEQGVKTLDDLADLAADELRFAISGQRGEHSLEDIGRVPNAEVDRILQASPMGQDDANAIIMAARAHWFDDEPAAEGGEAEEADAGAEA
jgi:N utilization substance protein A